MSWSSVRGPGAARIFPAPRPLDPAPVVTNRSRLIRGGDVGLHRPISLSIRPPLPASLAGDDVAAPRDETASQEQLPSPPAADEVREAARLQGYDEGYQKGYQEGLAAAELRLAQSVERLQRLAARVLESHAGFYRAAERQVIDLALQVAQRVVEREVENVPDLAAGVVRAALEEMDARTAVRLRVSPEDEEVLRRRWTTTVPPGIDPARIELVVDPRVQGGGAVIETTQGQVDAQLETKLAQLGNALWSFTAQQDEEPGVAADA